MLIIGHNYASKSDVKISIPERFYRLLFIISNSYAAVLISKVLLFPSETLGWIFGESDQNGWS